MADSADIISKLKFISRIKKGDKINVKYLFVQRDSFFTNFSRSFINRDSRDNTLHFIKTTISKSCDIIRDFRLSEKSSEQKMGENVLHDLEKSLEGLSNLKSTYNQDVMFCCSLDTVIQEIESKIEELKHPKKKI